MRAGGGVSPSPAAPRAGPRRGTADAPPRPRRRRAGRARRRARGAAHRLRRLRGRRGARGAGRARDAPHRRLDPAPLERERRALEAAALPLARGGRRRAHRRGRDRAHAARAVDRAGGAGRAPRLPRRPRLGRGAGRLPGRAHARHHAAVPERGGRRAGRHDAHDGDHRRAARLRARAAWGRRADAARPRPLSRARHARQGAGRPGPGRAHGARLRARESAAGSRAPPRAAAPCARLPRRRRGLVRPRLPPPRHGLRRQADHLRERRGAARALARGWRSGDLARRHAVAWTAVVLVFFSLAPLKRAAYLLPLRPALALVIGWWLAEAAEEERPAGGWVAVARGLAVVAAAGLLALAATAGAIRWGLVPSARLIEQGARHEIDAAMYLRVVAAAWAASGALGLTGALAAALAARALGRARWREAALATAASVACTTIVVYGLFVPARAAQKSVKPFAHAVRDRLGPDDRLALLASDEEIPFIFHVD